MQLISKDKLSNAINKGSWLVIPARGQYHGLELRYAQVTNVHKSNYGEGRRINVKFLTPGGNRRYTWFAPSQIVSVPKYKVPSEIVKKLS